MYSADEGHAQAERHETQPHRPRPTAQDARPARHVPNPLGVPSHAPGRRRAEPHHQSHLDGHPSRHEEHRYERSTPPQEPRQGADRAEKHHGGTIVIPDTIRWTVTATARTKQS